MFSRQQIFAILVSSALLLLVLELIRRRRLRERYALLWIGSAVFFLLLAIKIEILGWISGFLGFAIPANALFLFGMIALILIILSITVAISSMARRSERLVQEIALLNKKIEEREIKHHDD